MVCIISFCESLISPTNYVNSNLLRYIFYIVLFFSTPVFGQHLNGKVVDENNIGIPSVKIINVSKSIYLKSDVDGNFSVRANLNDELQFIFSGYDTTFLVISSNKLKKNQTIQLKNNSLKFEEVNVTANRLKEFDVGFLPAIKGVQIYTGTNAVIRLSKLNGAKSTANPREMFAKIPGLNIWESDGAGIQIGIGGRGLSPNRTANFNTRQNGYDISADALGYPESYYTPPFEALKSVEIIRGSASLQFGTQFGGLLNFVIKDPSSRKFEFTTRNTGGMYGYFGTFNRVSGTLGRFTYQAYYQFKRGDGYRENSRFHQHQAFAQVGYYLNENMKIRLEYTHMNYLARQAGGLSDVQFEIDSKQSFRDRNWFKVNWNMLALHYDYDIGKKSTLNVRAFGMLSQRQTLGYLGKITTSDPGGKREMISGDFKNAGVEARFLHRYNVIKDTSKTKWNGAFLVGGRYYRGNSTANQGTATDGFDSDFTFQNPNNLEGSAFDYPSENLAFFAENIFFIGKRWTINLGARLENIRSNSEGTYKQYAIHPINNDTLAIYTLGDTNEVKRTVPLFGGGFSFKTSKSSKIYTNITQNYRAINFTDIRINNPNIVVDQNIKDEYGFTGEIGFRGLIKDFFICDLAGFYVFYGDKIGLAPKPGTILKERTNIGDARNLGVELFTEFDFIKAFTDSSKHSFSLFVNAAYINARYIRSKEPNYINKEVEYVSPFILKTGLKYRWKWLSMQIQGSFNSSQFADASNSIEPSGDAVLGKVPSYFVMDFSTKVKLPKGFSLETGVNNLTNAKYFTRRATGYPGPGILPSDGISAYLTIAYQFKTKN